MVFGVEAGPARAQLRQNMVRGTWALLFRRRIWIQSRICATKKGVGRRLAFWLTLEMGDGNG